MAVEVSGPPQGIPTRGDICVIRDEASRLVSWPAERGYLLGNAGVEMPAWCLAGVWTEPVRLPPRLEPQSPGDKEKGRR